MATNNTYFGTGLLEFTPSGANPTPIQIGVLQDVSIEMSQSIKKLFGQYRAPVDAAFAELQITGKAKSANIFGAAMQQVLAGSSINTAASTIGAQNEVGTIPGTPFQITVANSATFVEDLGVIDTTSGVRLTRVAAAPTTGQYAVAAGVYTFAAADTGHVVWISYSYTAASGVTVSYSNTLMGQATTFTGTFFNAYAGRNLGVKLYGVLLPKWTYSFKNVDFTTVDVDFEAIANSAGKVIDQYSSQ